MHLENPLENIHRFFVNPTIHNYQNHYITSLRKEGLSVEPEEEG
jgi:hypothetical protein